MHQILNFFSYDIGKKKKANLGADQNQTAIEEIALRIATDQIQEAEKDQNQDKDPFQNPENGPVLGKGPKNSSRNPETGLCQENGLGQENVQSQENGHGQENVQSQENGHGQENVQSQGSAQNLENGHVQESAQNPPSVKLSMKMLVYIL